MTPSKQNRRYRIWAGMKTRCDNPNNKLYKWYGGRGIKYCERWKEFKNFFEDMKDSYQDNLTLERIDNNGNYTLENCRWATMKEQRNNTSANRFIVLDGMRKTLTQWIEFYGLKSSTVRQRFYVYGWGIERALERTGR